MDVLSKTEAPEERGKIIAQLLQTGVSLADIMEVPHEKLEQSYELAMTFFHEEQYHQVVKILPSLILTAPKEKKYWMLLGTTLCLCHHYHEALVCHSMASILDPADPYPYYYAALSYLETGNHADCQRSLDCALQCAHRDHQHYALEQKLVTLKKEISQMNVKKK
jgi:predicted Zn-dependent protease